MTDHRRFKTLLRPAIADLPRQPHVIRGRRGVARPAQARSAGAGGGLSIREDAVVLFGVEAVLRDGAQRRIEAGTIQPPLRNSSRPCTGTPPFIRPAKKA
ncbi:hypothetical protein [Sphingomonas sp. PP-CE-3G-477]|uniref:hypothetical protein n=1 Tax=Sphingomonas sp. PP-CE-3G-477 TaxID=2135660 RepID=UPI000D3730A4|nr:hypothetical protein [Sphingomonas sp. PP-CE-3G-477]